MGKHYGLFTDRIEAVVPERSPGEIRTELQCCSITGSNDYLLKIIERDTESLEKFIMQKLLRLGIVRASTTNLILRQKKYTTALPL